MRIKYNLITHSNIVSATISLIVISQTQLLGAKLKKTITWMAEGFFTIKGSCDMENLLGPVDFFNL